MAIFRDYIAAAVLFNVQILPETLVSGLFVLAVVLANGPVLGMAVGTAGTQLLASTVGRLLMKYVPDSTTILTSQDMCSQGYVGKSWERLLRGSANPDQLWHPMAPSIFQATIGFLAGYGFALQQLYKEEINAGVLSRSMMTTVAIIAVLLMLLTITFRVASGCETILGAVGGTLLGLLVGYLGTIALGYATDRRATNVWGAPLLRDRINNGSAVYVCDA